MNVPGYVGTKPANKLSPTGSAVFGYDPEEVRLWEITEDSA